MVPRSAKGRNRPVEVEEKLSWKERFTALKHVPRFLREVWNTNPKLTLIGTLLRLVRSVLPLAILYVGKAILDEVVTLNKITDPSLNHLWQLVAIEGTLLLLTDLLTRANAFADAVLGDQFSNATSVHLMQHAGTLDLAQFENPEFYDKLDRARRQTITRSMLFGQVLGMVQDATTLLSLSIGLLAFSPWILLLVVAAAIPTFLSEGQFNQRTYSMVTGFTPQRRELDYLRYIGASNETAKEVKIFGLSNFIVERFRNLAVAFTDANRKLAGQRALWGGALAAIGTVAYYFAYGYMLYVAVIGAITLGTLVFLAGAYSRMRTLLDGLLARFNTVAENALYLSDYFDFFDLQPNLIAPPSPVPFPEVVKVGFRFNDVGFQYPGAEKWALRHLNFTLHVGEKLALVGENGAGKTTLVKLITQLYAPTEGVILLDEIPLSHYDPAELRANIGVIFQDFVRFSFSARENLAVGSIEDREDFDSIKNAAQLSLADSVIAKLPLGYDQIVTGRLATGVDLSGGEWQKLALGRAYMRNAQLLILDEPTSALDARAEFEVFQRFTDLTRGKMALLISHRFSTVRIADRILVIEGGEMRELGSHQELLDKGGRYAELFKLQAAGYR